MEHEWDTLFSDLASFMLNICGRERVGDSNTAESVLVTIQCYTQVLNCIIRRHCKKDLWVIFGCTKWR